jgi:Topoisomerase IA
VQTPTRALVCQRYLENKSLTSQTYFRLKLHTAKNATAFAAFSAERYDNESATSESRAAAIGAGSVLVTKVGRREVTEQPPLLYDLNAKKPGNH